MATKTEILSKIHEVGVVAVIRAKSHDEAEKIADACVKGGVTILELTFTVPAADKLIAHLREKYDGTDVIVGAGTVTDEATARIAILSGAQFVVSPHFDEKIVRCCNRNCVAVMPGIFTPTEAVRALESGADVLKVFPGDIATPKFISDFKGPFPNAVMMPSGGVSVDNVKDWFKAGAFAVGAGSSLTAGAKTGDYEKITETAKKFIEQAKR